MSTEPQTTKRPFIRRPLGIAVTLAVALLVVAGIAVVGAEFYVRQRATSLVADAVGCEVQDTASASLSTAPPVLWQYLTKHYTDISVQTAGNQVRGAKGMKIDVDIQDIRLTGNSEGTIGALDGTLSWSLDGIKQSVQDALSGLGSILVNKVSADPSAGTVELKGVMGVDHVTVKPQIADGGLQLQLVEVSLLGKSVSKDDAQKALDDLTSKATKNYPLTIHADSVQVTDTEIVAKFSSQNATISSSSSGSSGDGQGSCLSDL